MSYRKYYYDYIKREIDNMAIFEQVLNLKKTGVIYKSTCPFHTEKTPSFIVYPPGHITHNDKQEFASFYCFGCGVGGDIIKFNQLYKNLSSYQESAKDLAKQYDLKNENDEEVEQEYIEYILPNEEEKMLDMEEINLLCSQLIKNNPNAEKYYKWLDEQLDERDTEEAQSLVQEIKNFLKADL